MPSPATRSSRLTKSKQAEVEDDAASKKTKASATPNRVSAKKSTGNKSPGTNQETMESSPVKTTRSKRNVNQDEHMDSSSPKNVATETSKENAVENESPVLNKPAKSKISTLDISLTVGKDNKKSVVDVKKSSVTPTTVPSVRRSSRAPVPSSRFKDMEVALTPNSQKTKRAFAANSPSDSDSVEPSPKRVRKNSNKSSVDPLPDDFGKECPHPSPQTDKEIVDSAAQESHFMNDSAAKELDKESALSLQKEKSIVARETTVLMQTEDSSAPENTIVPSHEENNSVENRTEISIGVDAPSYEVVSEKEDVEVAVQSSSDGSQMNEDTGMQLGDVEVSEKDQLVGLSTDGTTKNVVGNSTNEEVKSTTCDQNVLVSPEVSFSTTDDASESVSQEVSVEEVGLSCQDGGLIVEETVHTYMDEKDVVIQNTDMACHLEMPEEATNVSQVSNNLELSLDRETTEALSSSLMLKGQEVTVQERDGKMVAIVKIPGNLSSIPNTPSHSEIGKQTEESSFLLSSNSSKSTGAPAAKSRHGYILNKKPEKQPYITISDQDQNTFNIAVEPTTMSSILKSKPSELTAKTNQKSLYGRVIKQEAGIAKSNTGVTPAVQNAPSTTSLVIKKTGSNPTISLLPQSIKATNPKDSKPYSLLSSPSELLQKLKSDTEQKQSVGTTIQEQSQKVTTVSPSPKKVVIISHPSKSGGVEIENSTDSSLLIGDESSIVEHGNADSSQQTTEDSTIISTDSELTHETVPTEDKVIEESTMEVVDETTSEAIKIEEIVASDSCIDDDGAEQQDKSENSTDEILESLPSTEEKSENENGQGFNAEEFDKTKELIIEPSDAFSQSAECGEDISSDLLISHEVDKSTLEETVITSGAQGDIVVKQEIDIESDNTKGEEKAGETRDAKGKGDTPAAKTQKIKLVDNGVVYELQIVSDGETRALQVQDGGIAFDGINEEGVVVKQEVVDEDGNTSTDTSGKSTLGTQTVYASKRGRPRSSTDKDDADAPVHKLATIVQEGGQKKHFYYVSVVPGKTMDGKYRRSVEHVLPGCDVTDTGEYCCKECDYRTDKKANFYKHRRLHTGSKPHVCQVCKYQARTSSNLKRHMGIHDDIREFKCTQCALSFRQKIHLERHIRYRHEEKRVKCPMCDYVCANEQPDLKMHIKRKHTQESGKVFTCPQCNIEVGSKRDLKQHLKFHKDGPELKLFCKECSFVTDCKSRLQRHLVVHSNVKPYHCGVCDYKATQKEHVVRHLRSQHKIEVNKPKRPWKKQSKQEAGAVLGGNSRGDFTCGDKIFACNHCSMRFAKLINLYKHLHTQHTDIMPAESESNYYCVVCEFSTSSKKNLLIHMRRHNMTDQTPPTHVYSCVLCRYVNPRRRNLFQHMRKKHNIDISTQVDIAGMTAEEEAAVRQDGGDKIAEFIQSEQGIITQTNTEEIATTSSFEIVDGNAQVLKDNLAGVANMIKIEDLTRVAAGADVKDNSTGLVIDNGDGTQLIQAASLMQHKAADAIEGLQALAGQAGLIIDEEVTTIETKPSIVLDQSEVGVINTDATLADGSSIILSADQSIVEEQVATIEEASSEQIQHIVESVESAEADAGMTSLELTEEQLSSLHHGDIVQMEGQVYMVELAQDPDSPDKQLLSFLPINQG